MRKRARVSVHVIKGAWFYLFVFVVGLFGELGTVQAQETDLYGAQVINNEQADEDGDGTANEAGNLLIENLVRWRNSTGLLTGGAPGFEIYYQEPVANVYEVMMRALKQDALFIWGDSPDVTGVISTRMELDKDNILYLYDRADPQNARIILTPSNSGSSITVDGAAVVTQGTGGDAYLTQDASDARYLQTAVLAVGFGTGLLTDGANQLVVGQYNQTSAQDAFQIGGGTGLNEADRANALSVTHEGDLTVGRDLLVARNQATTGDAVFYGTLRTAASGDVSMGSYTQQAGGVGTATALNDVLHYVQKVEALKGAAMEQAAVAKLVELAQFLEHQDLWKDTALIIFQEAYNTGDPTTAYALGGWATHDVELEGTVLWSADGASFNNPSGGGTAKLVLDGLYTSVDDFTVMSRIRPSQASAPNVPHGAIAQAYQWGQGDKFWAIGGHTSIIPDETWALVFVDAQGDARLGTLQQDFSWGADEDFVETFQTSSTKGTKLWKNTALIPFHYQINTTTADNNTPRASGYDKDLYFRVATHAMDGRYSLLLLFRVSLEDAAVRNELIRRIQHF